MKNGLLLGVLTAAVAILVYREFMHSKKKKKCTCSQTDSTTVTETASPAETTTVTEDAAAPAAVVMPMDGWGKFAAI